MDPGDELCVCFHVPVAKLVRFIRQTQPTYPSQCSECFGAGTGCGWCIPFIESIFEQMEKGESEPEVELAPEEYVRRRRAYLERVKMERIRPDNDGVELTDRLERPED